MGDDTTTRPTHPGLNPDGWTRVPNSVLLDARTAELTSTELVVLVYLLAHRNQQTGLAWPSQDTIAEESGLGLSTVRIAVVRLREVGLLGASRRRHDGRTRLVCTFPTIDQCAAGCATPMRRELRNTNAQRAAQHSTTVAQNGDECCAADCAPLRSGLRAHKEEQTIEQTKNSSSSEDAAAVAAAACLDFIRGGFGKSAAERCRPDLDGWTVAELKLLAGRAEREARNPAAWFIAAVRDGFETPKPRPSLTDGVDRYAERQTDDQRSENIRVRVSNNYGMAAAEATPDQAAAIEAQHGDLAAIIAADPLRFADDRTAHMPDWTISRLLAYQQNGAVA